MFVEFIDKSNDERKLVNTDTFDYFEMKQRPNASGTKSTWALVGVKVSPDSKQSNSTKIFHKTADHADIVRVWIAIVTSLDTRNLHSKINL